MQKNLIGIIADTHDNRDNIRRAVSIFNQKSVGLVVHAGDFVAPFTVLDFKHLSCPMQMVFGNNDGERIGLDSAFKKLGTLLPGPRSFPYEGKQFLLMHEHNCLKEVCASGAVDIVIYGHTHEVDIQQGKPLIINPGEAGGWLKGRATIAILDLDRLATELIALQP
jgi:hypothetical protein